MILVRMGKGDDTYVAILIASHERNRPIRSPRPVRNEDFRFDRRVGGQKATNCIDAGTPCQSVTINNVASVVRLERGAIWPRTVTNQFRWMAFLVQSLREGKSPCRDTTVGQAGRERERHRGPAVRRRVAVTTNHRVSRPIAFEGVSQCPARPR